MALLAAGLYLISNDDPLPLLLAKLDAALATGAIALLQYRRKQTAPAEREMEARQLLAFCQRYAVPLIINDDVALAERLGCGVHLGQSDGSVIEARQRLGQAAIIGRTCHDSLDFARQAVADGASYVAFGAVYASKTKPHAQTVSLTTLRQAKQQLNVPVCVIGGLTAENVQPCVDLAVDLYAVVSDVLGLPVEEVAIRVEMWSAALEPIIEELQLNRLIQQIEKAFDGVVLGQGWGLREADARDDYMVSAQTLADCRAQDEHDDWRALSPADLDQFSCALSFTNSEGMIFLLPAYLIADIRCQLNVADVEFHLTRSELLEEKFCLLNLEQREAVISYLNWVFQGWMLRDDYPHERHPVLLQLTEGYWSTPHPLTD